MRNYKDSREKKENNNKRRKLFFVVLVPLLVLLLCAMVYGSYLFVKASSTVKSSFENVTPQASLREQRIDPKKDNISILFIGIDESDMRKEKYGFNETNTRTDALILATLNEENKSVKLVSIPRDSYVDIACTDEKSKINSAHVKGGTLCTIETVENLFNVPVDYYVKLNFNAFIEVVDSLGGIEFDVPYDLKEKDSFDRSEAIVLHEGVQQLNGEEALAVARTRKYDNDIERGKRQQQLIQAILKETVSFASITKYSNMIEAIGENMKTNMKFGEILSFYDYVTQGSDMKVDSLTLKGEDYRINHIYYYKLHEESVKEISEILQSHLEVPNTK